MFCNRHSVATTQEKISGNYFFIISYMNLDFQSWSWFMDLDLWVWSLDLWIWTYWLEFKYLDLLYSDTNTWTPKLIQSFWLPTAQAFGYEFNFLNKLLSRFHCIIYFALFVYNKYSEPVSNWNQYATSLSQRHCMNKSFFSFPSKPNWKIFGLPGIE